MDPREERFLASQAERLATNKKQNNNNRHHHRDEVCPQLDDDSSSCNSKSTNDDIITTSKETNNQFFTNFRKLCTQFQCQIDALLFIPPPSSNDNNEIAVSSNQRRYDDAKSYYVTSRRRNEGQIQLDVILQNVRSLQRHALSSSSSINIVTIVQGNNKNDNDNHNESLLLQTILQTPMTDVTQTDVRLISQEIDKMIRYIDDAKGIVCPKEKFVFKRYRAAMMAERERRVLGVDEKDGVPIDSTTAVLKQDTIASKDDNDPDKNKMGEDVHERQKQQQDNNLRTKYGGVLENKSNCTIEISSHGTILIDEQRTMDSLQYYTAPRSAVHALLHPSSQVDKEQQQSTNVQQEESSSYLLQNLQNVTILIHGSRPSLHLQHIHNCKIYISEPTLGPVHVTNCHSSTIHCSCYQLRIHDSKDVTFHVWVRSGPIIEDCTDIKFVGDYYSDGEKKTMNENDDGAAQSIVGRNMYWDVKDFNWLRALRKSPNFVVVPMSSSDGDDKVVESRDTMSRTRNATADSQMQESVKPAVTEEEEEDSEDEL